MKAVSPATLARSPTWAAVAGGASTRSARLSQIGTICPASVPDGAGTAPVLVRPPAVHFACVQTSHEFIPLSDIIGPGAGCSRVART